MTLARLRTISLVALALAAAACEKKGVKGPRPIDPDANSGPDARRSGAVAIAPNQPVTDEVNFDKQDQTDWKSVELRGKPGILAVELHWDDPGSELDVDLFDAVGVQVAASPGGATGAQLKKIAYEVEQPGVYFIRVRAPRAKCASVYTVLARWEGGRAPAPEPVVEKEPAPVEKPEPVHHAKHHAHHDHEGGVQGRIVSSYREGGALILHLDKGSAARIKPGMSGTILEGPAGETPLEGGSFTITQVIDDGRSIARAALHSTGRNTRVVIDTGR